MAPLSAPAQETEVLPSDLTLSQAVELALQRNPDLAVSAYELRAAEPRIVQAGVRPNPELGLDVENFGVRGDAESDEDAFELTLTLSQVIELGGKRASRQGTAMAQRDVLVVERQAAQLDMLAEVARRFIAVVAAQEQLSLVRDASKVAAQTLSTITARVKAARSPNAERLRASIAEMRTRLEEQKAEGALDGARHMLSAMWGSPQAVFGAARAELFALSDVEPLENLLRRAARNPDFLRFGSEARLREAEVRLQRAIAVPSVTLRAGVRRFEGAEEVPFVASVSLPLPVFDRNQGALREAELRREQNDVERQAALVRTETTLRALYQQLLRSGSEVKALREKLIPEALAAAEQTQHMYERGRFSYLELADARRELIDLQLLAIEVAANYHELHIEIERLTREPLAPDTRVP